MYMSTLNKQQQQESSSSLSPTEPPSNKIPESNPDPRKCSFWNEKRNKFCHFEVKQIIGGTNNHSNNKFCVHHLPAADVAELGEKDKRIPCPLNPNHTIFKKNLQKHLKVCPDGKFDVRKLPYYCKGLHTPDYYKQQNDVAAVSSDEESVVKKSKEPNTTTLSAVPVRVDEKFANQTNHRNLNPEQLLDLWRLIVNVFREFVASELFTFSLMNDECSGDKINNDEQWVFDSLYLKRDENEDEDKKDHQANTQQLSQNFLGTNQRSTTSQKHGVQHQALVRLLNQIDVIQNSRNQLDVIVELGAGKGGLALAVADAIVNNRRRQTDQCSHEIKKIPQFIVADRGGFRRKADSRVGKDDNNNKNTAPNHNDDDDSDAKKNILSISSSSIKYPSFQRLRIDAQDLDLFKVPIEKSNDDSIDDNTRACVLGKHLCGACTDFTISACFLAGADENSSSSSNPTQNSSSSSKFITEVDSILIATCCHHRCEKKYFEHLISQVAKCLPGGSSDHQKVRQCFNKISGDDIFGAIVSLTSWATCGHAGRSKGKDSDDIDGYEHVDNEEAHADGDTDEHDDGPSLPERRERESEDDGNTVEDNSATNDSLITLHELLKGDDILQKVPTTPIGRERAGRLCKLILDWIRCECIRMGDRKFKHSVKLVPFMPDAKKVTKENWAILAW